MAQDDVSTDVSKDGSMKEYLQMGHENMGHSSKSAPDMSILKAVPASGKGREAGFDNNYIMLGRESWKKCGKQAP